MITLVLLNCQRQVLSSLIKIALIQNQSHQIWTITKLSFTLTTVVLPQLVFVSVKQGISSPITQSISLNQKEVYILLLTIHSLLWILYSGGITSCTVWDISNQPLSCRACKSQQFVFRIFQVCWGSRQVFSVLLQNKFSFFLKDLAFVVSSVETINLESIVVVRICLKALSKSSFLSLSKLISYKEKASFAIISLNLFSFIVLQSSKFRTFSLSIYSPSLTIVLALVHIYMFSRLTSTSLFALFEEVWTSFISLFYTIT